MPTGQPGIRQVGVIKPKQESTEQAPTQKLVNLAPSSMYGVEYGDATGRKVTTVVVKIGNRWYMPPNADQWASQLRPIASWLAKQLEERVIEGSVAIPEKDQVDILEMTDAADPSGKAAK